MLADMAKILTIRLPEDLAEYLAQTALNSRLSVNRTVETFVRFGRDNGWTEVSMVPAVRRPADDA